nr:choice-of-anchor D domain-containing protein [Candidatus Cloacimonadota bacterium]
LQIIYNDDYVHNELAVVFKKIVDWMQMIPAYGFISQGDSAAVEITVSAEELIPDNFTCYLLVSSNDPNNNEIFIPINLYVTSEFPCLYLTTEEIDFGEILVGESSMETITLSNIGNLPLEITEFTISDPVFSTNQTAMIIEAGASVDLEVTFAPQNVETYQAVLTIYSNDYLHPEKEVALSGIGFGVNNHDLPILVTNVEQNFPNPFNPSTTINFSLAESGRVKLSIYNMKGERVKTLMNTELVPDNYSVVWNGIDDNGKKVSSGVYMYQFQTKNVNEIKKMLLIK